MDDVVAAESNSIDELALLNFETSSLNGEIIISAVKTI